MMNVNRVIAIALAGLIGLGSTAVLQWILWNSPGKAVLEVLFVEFPYSWIVGLLVTAVFPDHLFRLLVRVLASGKADGAPKE